MLFLATSTVLDSQKNLTYNQSSKDSTNQLLQQQQQQQQQLY